MSQQIRALEEELGVPLFVRTRNRLMRLTEAGESVVEAAHSALNEIAKVHAVGRSRTAAQFSSLRIGCTHAQARYALPHAARLFRRRYPGIQLQVMHKHDEELWQTRAKRPGGTRHHDRCAESPERAGLPALYRNEAGADRAAQSSRLTPHADHA
jgi:hypothetical protein